MALRAHAWLAVAALTATASLCTRAQDGPLDVKISVKEGGRWPAWWPSVFEPLRKPASTLYAENRVQETVYEIPIKRRKDYDRVMHALAQMLTPGSTVRVFAVDAPPAQRWGHAFANTAPGLRVYTPPYTYTGGPQSPPKGIISKMPVEDLEQLVAEERLLRAGPPWPPNLKDERGHLPEYVRAKVAADKLSWTPTTLEEDTVAPKVRARVDLDIVADGTFIDTTNLKLPEGVKLEDSRATPQP